MDISKIDKNFSTEYKIDGEEKFYDVRYAPFKLYGVHYEEETKRFVRLPSKVAKTVSENVYNLNFNTAGGRVRFATNSKTLTVKFNRSGTTRLPHMAEVATSGFSLIENTDKKSKFVCSFMEWHYSNVNCTNNGDGFTITQNIGGGKLRYYTLYLPLYNDVLSLELGFEKNSKVLEGKKYKDIKPILYYGSSITQGACANRPDNSYESIIEQQNGIDYINLGFSGSCKAEKEMAEFLAKKDCSVFVCDYDYNSTVEELEKRHLSLYKTFRSFNNATPVIFISNPNYYVDKTSKKRLKIIKNTYDYAIKSGDRNVYLIEGKEFYKKLYDRCTVDNTHPTDLGFYFMAKRIKKELDKILN